jgi:acetyl esterase/lipase
MKIVLRCAALRLLAFLPLFGLLEQPLCAATDPLQPPGTEAHVYRQVGAVSLSLYVFKPAGWKADDRRPAFVWFFGGGGKPTNGTALANWATALGLIAIVPDYREKARFGTTRPDSVADGRAAVRWIQEHATELGLDPKKIVVSGNSAGGCLALWTAISHAPPGSDPAESPLVKPAALILTSATTATARDTGYPDPVTLSPLHQIDAQMPPVLLFHGDADEAVPYQSAVALHDKLAATGNVCELITVPRGAHNYAGKAPAWWPRTLEISRWFLQDQGLISK